MQQFSVEMLLCTVFHFQDSVQVYFVHKIRRQLFKIFCLYAYNT